MLQSVFVGHLFDEGSVNLLKSRSDQVKVVKRKIFTFPASRKYIGTYISKLFPDSEVIPVVNRGRDMFPFLHALKHLGESELVIIKWHDKRRNHFNGNDLSYEQRMNLLDYCLPGRGLVFGPLEKSLIDNDGANLSTLEGWLLPISLRLGSNALKLNYFALQENWAWEDILRSACFPAGGIFAIRSRSVMGSKWLEESHSDIEFGHGGLDGTWAHASERWLGVLAGRNGEMLEVGLKGSLRPT